MKTISPQFHKPLNMNQSLKIEILTYFLVYTIFLIYGIYQIYQLSDVIEKKNVINNSFTVGWKFLRRKRDSLDYEWESWKEFLFKNFLWFIIYPIITEIVRLFSKSCKATIKTHAIFGMIFIWSTYNIIILLLILIKILTFAVIMNGRKRSHIWIYAVFWILLINLLNIENHEIILNYLHINRTDCSELTIILSWMLLKVLSFSLDYIGTNQSLLNESNYDLTNIFGYALYFPSLFFGPILIYKRYVKMSQNIKTSDDLYIRMKRFIGNLLRVLFWFYVAEFSLHYLYINILRYNIQIVQQLNPWALYTFGYLMGQFFHIKYVVAYGLGMAIADFERIETPALPKCIARIHWYSDMWKYFDQGFYEFLSLYIYTAILSNQSLKKYNKMIAGLLTFFFVYIWHGLYLFVFIWSMINFVSLQIERLIKKYFSINGNNTKEITITNRKRLIGLIGSQIFIPSALSNFYFFGELAVGNVFVNRTYWQFDLLGYLVLSSCTYCIYHVSETVKYFEMKKK